MNGLTQDDSRAEILAVLAKIGAGNSWKQQKQAKRAFEVLEYLVKNTLAKVEVTETGIGQDVLNKKDYDPKNDNQARALAGIIRAGLKLYNESEGQADPWMIDLPAKTYVPTFSKRPSTLSVAPPPVPPTPQEATRNWQKPIIIAAIVVVGALLAVASIPSLQEGHCGGDITITQPINGTTVSTNAVVQGKKNPQYFWCWCKDYLVVEVASGGPIVGARYNQGRISNSANWSLGATFGDRHTADGTQFNIFVVSTTHDLKTNFIPNAVGNSSVPISVTLKK
jgi:hypothetical protein